MAGGCWHGCITVRSLDWRLLLMDDTQNEISEAYGGECLYGMGSREWQKRRSMQTPSASLLPDLRLT
jgi:hypothetical protein